MALGRRGSTQQFSPSSPKLLWLSRDGSGGALLPNQPRDGVRESAGARRGVKTTGGVCCKCDQWDHLTHESKSAETRAETENKVDPKRLREGENATGDCQGSC